MELLVSGMLFLAPPAFALPLVAGRSLSFLCHVLLSLSGSSPGPRR